MHDIFNFPPLLNHYVIFVNLCWAQKGQNGRKQKKKKKLNQGHAMCSILDSVYHFIIIIRKKEKHNTFATIPIHITLWNRLLLFIWWCPWSTMRIKMYSQTDIVRVPQMVLIKVRGRIKRTQQDNETMSLLMKHGKEKFNWTVPTTDRPKPKLILYRTKQVGKRRSNQINTSLTNHTLVHFGPVLAGGE